MRLLAILFHGLFALAAIAEPPAPSTVPTSPTAASPSSTDGEESDSDEIAQPEEAQSSINEFQGDEIGLVLRTLARQANANVVISDKVGREGTVTMRVANKTPLETLIIIAQSKGLVVDQINNVYFIKTVEEFARMPTDKMLDYTTERLVAPLARLKGAYYKELTAQGVPDATASEIVLREKLSKGAFATTPPVAAPSPSPWSGPTSSPVTSLFDHSDKWLPVGAIVVSAVCSIPVMLLHFAIALAVWFSARRVERAGESLTFFGPFLWALVTLVGGILAAGLFWLIHHSTLRHPTTS